MAKPFQALTAEHEAAMPAHRDKWIARGHSTEPADRERVERGVRASYRFAGLAEPKRVVWVQSPAVLLVAAPLAALKLAQGGAVGGAVDCAVRAAVGGAVDCAVRAAVGGAVDGAVLGAVEDAVGGAVRFAVGGAVGRAVGGAELAVGGAVDGVVHGAVETAVRGAVGRAVRNAVEAAVRNAVGGAVGGAVRGAVVGAVGGAAEVAISQGRYRYLGGRWWASGWYWGSAYTSFFRDVVGAANLDVAPEIWERSRAYEDMMSGGYLWLHKDFAMIAEPATTLRLEDRGGENYATRYALHATDGPAVRWPDGTALWFLHGAQIKDGATVISGDRPGLTVERIRSERNIEVRRRLIELYGRNRYLRDAEARLVDIEHAPAGFVPGNGAWPTPDNLRYRALWEMPMPGDEPMVVVDVVNSSPEPLGYPADGENYIEIGGRVWKRYMLRVDPRIRTASAAVAKGFRRTALAYAPAAES